MNCNCYQCVTELGLLVTKNRIRDMKQIGLLKGQPLLDPNETQVLLTQQLWTDEDKEPITERLPRQS